MMNSNRIKAIVKKDLKLIMSRTSVWLPLILVPLILCVLLPVIILTLGLKLGGQNINNIGEIEKIFHLYNIPAGFTTQEQKFSYIFMNYMFIPLFLILPVMTSSIIASYSIVGEKEQKTLETLLYTPVINQELLTAKLLSAFIPAYITALCSFFVYFIVSNTVSYFFIETIIVRSSIWVPVVLLLSPAVSVITLALNLLISLRSKTSQEAQQLSGMVVVPLVLIMVSQIQGLLVLNLLYVIIFSLILLVVSYYLLKRTAPRFDRETMIKTL